MAATLVKAMGTAADRNTSLALAPGLSTCQYVFERASFRTSLKSAAVTLPANCMFVVTPVDGLGSGSYARGFYAQAQKSSSVERLCLIHAVTEVHRLVQR